MAFKIKEIQPDVIFANSTASGLPAAGSLYSSFANSTQSIAPVKPITPVATKSPTVTANAPIANAPAPVKAYGTQFDNELNTYHAPIQEGVNLYKAEVNDALLKAIFIQESSAGKDASNKAKDAGDYGWLMGITKDGGYFDIMRDGIYDVTNPAKNKRSGEIDGIKTPEAAFQVASSILAKAIRNNKPGGVKTAEDALDLYERFYKTNKGSPLSLQQKQAFKDNYNKLAGVQASVPSAVAPSAQNFQFVDYVPKTSTAESTSAMATGVNLDKGITGLDIEKKVTGAISGAYKASMGAQEDLMNIQRAQSAKMLGITDPAEIAKLPAVDITGVGAEMKSVTSLLENKDILKTITKLADPDEIIPLIKSFFKTPEEAAIVAKDLATTKTVKETKAVLQSFEKSIAPDAIPTVAQKELGYAKSVKESPQIAQEVKTAIPDTKYTPRSTSELVSKAYKSVQDSPEVAETLFRSKTDDESVAIGTELVKHYSRLASEATDVATKTKYAEKAAEITIDNAYKGLELGRAVQAFSTLNKLEPESLVKYAAKKVIKYNEELPLGAKKIPNLTGEQFTKITEEAKKIKGMVEGEGKQIATQKLFDEINKLVPSSLYQKIVSVWKAGLLTGLKTTGGNILSNTMHGAMELTKDVPAFAVDKVASLFTGKRTIGLTGKGLFSGSLEGFKNGWNYLKTGINERDILSKFDYKKVSFGDSKIAKGLQKYEETIFRLMGAEDQPMFYGAKAHSIYSQAIAKAKNLRLKGAELKNEIEKLIKNPTDEMLAYAVQDAETAVFQNKTALGEVAKNIQKAKYKGKPIPGMEVIVPFAQTPSAVATQVINYSPVGIVKTIIQNIGKGKFNQREFSQQLGRGIVGTGVIAIGSALFAKGMINLSAPSNEKERNLWELEGRKQNSILVDGEWKSANYFGPAGNLLLIGGYFEQALKETGSPVQAFIQAIAGAGKSLTDQTFLQGVSGILNAVNDPTRYAEQFEQNTIGSVIPTIVADFAKATDQYNRDSKGVLPNLQSRIPGVRQSLPEKKDVFGETTTPGIGFLRIMADPLRPSPVKEDDTIKELRRLAEVGLNTTPSSIKDKFVVDGVNITLTPEQVNKLEEIVGKITKKAFDGIIESGNYKDLSDKAKSNLLNNTRDEALDAVRNKILTKAQILAGVKEKIQKEIKNRQQ